MNSILKNIKFLALFLGVALFVQSCTEDDDADGSAVMIEAGFTYALEESNGVVKFLNTSSNADTYSWTMVDAVNPAAFSATSTEKDPTVVFTSGTYDITLTARNAAGASATFTDQITLNVPVLPTLPFNFDQANIIYSPFVDPAAAFGGTAFEIVANPAPGGSNDAASQVGKITNSGSQWEGVWFDLLEPINLATDMTIQMDVWSDQPVEALLKLEQGAAFTEIRANHGGTGWENMIFTFDNADSYSRFVLFIGPGVEVPGTFFIDNIRQTATVDVTPPVITVLGDNPYILTVGGDYNEPGATATDNTDGDITSSITISGAVDTMVPGDYTVTYEVMDAAGNMAQATRTVTVEPCSDTNNLELTIDFDCPTIDFAGKIVGNVNFTVLENPDQSGVNAIETMVGQINNAGANWENAFFNLDTPVDFSTDKGIKMKFWSDQALPIKLKFEDGTANPVEVDANHGGSGWEELSFTFTSDASYNDMVIFVDGPGTASGAFYVDDIEQFAGDVGGGNDDAPTEAAPAPTQDSADVAGIYGDTYDNVPIANYDPNWGQTGHTLVNTNYDTGAGSVLAYPNFNYQGTVLDGFQDLSAMESLHVDIWVPEGTDRQVKVSPINDGSGTGAGEVLVQVPLTPGSWNSVDLAKADFTGMTWDAVKEMKFDGQFNGDGSANSNPFDIYLDNIYFWKNPGGGGSTDDLILDFENNLAGVTTGEFETSGSLIANPVSGGINTSPNVYEAAYTNANQWWGGVGFVFADGVLSQSTTTYKAKFYSTVAPTNVLFQVEVDGTNAPVGQVQEITTANEWVELTFTLDNIPAGVNRILVRPDVGNQNGTKPNTGSLYIDDIYAVAGSGGGGGGGGGTTTNNCSGDLVDATAFPVTFEGCESFLSTFGTIAVDIDANPDQTGINTSGYALKVEKNAGAEFWAGFQNNFPNTFPDMTTHSIKMKIYSSKANTKFRVEVAQDDPNVGNPPGSFVTISDANTWTEVVVPFTGVPAPEAYFRIAIKPDNDESDSPITADGVYYFDDIEIVAN